MGRATESIQHCHRAACVEIINITEAEMELFIILSLPKSRSAISTVLCATPTMAIDAIDAFAREKIERETNPHNQK